MGSWLLWDDSKLPGRVLRHPKRIERGWQTDNANFVEATWEEWVKSLNFVPDFYLLFISCSKRLSFHSETPHWQASTWLVQVFQTKMPSKCKKQEKIFRCLTILTQFTLDMKFYILYLLHTLLNAQKFIKINKNKNFYHLLQAIENTFLFYLGFLLFFKLLNFVIFTQFLIYLQTTPFFSLIILFKSNSKMTTLRFSF